MSATYSADTAEVVHKKLEQLREKYKTLEQQRNKLLAGVKFAKNELMPYWGTGAARQRLQQLITESETKTKKVRL